MALQSQLHRYHISNVMKTGTVLGTGAFGKVIEMKLPDGTIAAGKKFFKHLSNSESHVESLKVEEECERIRQLHHPNIVQFLGVHYKSGSDIPILIMEYLPMSLTNYLEQNKMIPSHIKNSILLDVSRGLLYLHKQTPPIIHCDLTADNVLLTSEMKAKISDFGVSCIFEPDPAKYYMRLSRFPGNQLYMPPEALTEGCKITGDNLDVFSFGVLILHVCTQQLPKPTGTFDKHNRPRTEVERRQHLLDQVENHQMRQLAEDCLHNDPQHRPHCIDLVRRIIGLNGIAIIVDNISGVTDESSSPLREDREQNDAESSATESSSLLSESCKEVQDLESLFRDKLDFLVLRFNNFTSEALHVLLTEVVETCHIFDIRAFALIILSEGKQQNLYDASNNIIPTQDVLNHFSSLQLADKPKIFVFETILTNTIDIKELDLTLPHNSISLTMYPQSTSQLPILTDRIQNHYHNTPISKTFHDIERQITDNGHHAEYQCNIDTQFILTNYQNDSTKEDVQHLHIAYQVNLAIWRPIRRKTIDLLEQHKDEVLKILRDVRIAKITGSATSLVIGGSLTIAGLVLIPFTLGTSVGLSVAGAGVGAAGSATTFGASIVSKVMSNSRVKKAQEHIKLDQQISEHVNKRGSEYNEALKKAGIVIESIQGGAGVGGRLGVGIAKGIAGIKAGATALKIGGAGVRVVAITGGAVGGLALLVTAPFDIYQIGRSSYDLVMSGQHGENEGNKTFVWYTEQIKKLNEELDYISSHQEDDSTQDD